MINGLEGIPGSGKSYESVVYHVLAAVKAGRKVITNLPLDVEQWAALDPSYPELIEIRRTPQPIRGTWDATAAGQDKPAYVLFDDGHVEQPDDDAFLFGGVWDYWTDWKRADGRGPLFVIDECHVPLPALGTSKAVVQWFKIHRHFNVDVLLMTQSFRDIDQSIARLLGMLYKVRKADILGEPDEYIRKVHGGYRGAVISTETRKYKPQYFRLYKSHTQGVSAEEAKASDVAPLIVKVNRLKWAVLGLGVLASLWAFWPKADKPRKAAAAHAAAPGWLKEAQGRAGAPMSAASVAAEEAKLGASSPSQVSVPQPLAERIQFGGPGAGSQPTSRNGQMPEPYGLKGLHLLGRLTLPSKGDIYMLTVSQNGAVVSQVTHRDLVQVGYRFTALSDCVASVQWGEQIRVVTCDSPSITVASQPRAAPAQVAAGQ